MDGGFSLSLFLFWFERKLRFLENDSSIIDSIFIFPSVSLLQHIRWTRAGCIPAFQTVFPLSYLLIPWVPCPASPSPSICIPQLSLEMIITYSPLDLALAKLNRVLSPVWWSWLIVFKKGHLVYFPHRDSRSGSLGPFPAGRDWSVLLWKEPDLLAKPLATRYSSEVLGDSCRKLVKRVPTRKQVRELQEAELKPIIKRWWSLGNAKWRQLGGCGESKGQSLRPLS